MAKTAHFGVHVSTFLAQAAPIAQIEHFGLYFGTFLAQAAQMPKDMAPFLGPRGFRRGPRTHRRDALRGAFGALWSRAIEGVGQRAHGAFDALGHGVKGPKGPPAQNGKKHKFWD